MDPVKILPTEVFEQILSYLNVKHLMSCCLVSQKWNIAANNDSLWKELCLRNDWDDCGSLKDRLNYVTFPPNEKSIFHDMSEWKKHFVLKNRLQNNWRSGTAVDYTFSPVDGDSSIKYTAVSSDGNSVIAFGFSNGVIKLYNLKKKGELMVTKECILEIPVSHIQILHDYVFVMQNSLFQAYKINADNNLELFCIKMIRGSLITNVDVPMIMLLDRKDRIVVLNESPDEYVVYHFSDNYMVFASSFPSMVYVYDSKFDFVEPYVTFNLNTDISDCLVFNLHIKDDILYVLIIKFTNVEVQAYSLRSKTILYDEIIAEEGFKFASTGCTFESNELYLIIRCDFNNYFLLERDTGKVLLKDNGIIFLNANSNPRLVGVLADDLFQTTDPSLGCNEYFCMTLEGLPLAVYSNVLVTKSFEFNSHGESSGEIEFWNMLDTSLEISKLTFQNTSSVSLLYKDSTKLIFYTSRECCHVRDYLV